MRLNFGKASLVIGKFTSKIITIFLNECLVGVSAFARAFEWKKNVFIFIFHVQKPIIYSKSIKKPITHLKGKVRSRGGLAIVAIRVNRNKPMARQSLREVSQFVD
jgi:hypothetical protein